MSNLNSNLTETWPVWRTVALGNFGNTGQVRKALAVSGVGVGNWADDLITHMKLSGRKETVKLVRVAVKQLGYPDGAYYQHICEAAKKQGLKLCSAEVGFQLRLQYLDQPVGEKLVVAMNPVQDSDGDLGLFLIERKYGGPTLLWGNGNPSFVWDARNEFVFYCK